MKKISIFNQKGGVGKTTSVVNIAVAINKLKKKVLVIDMDPQANTTTGLGVDKYEDENSIYDLFYEINSNEDENEEVKDPDNKVEEEKGEDQKIKEEEKEDKEIDFSKYIKETNSGVFLIK